MMSIYMAQRVKKLCFTLNNYTPEEENEIYEFCELKAVFAVVGREIGENGTPHLQGFINLYQSARFSAFKKVMPRAHLEAAKGTDAENLKYCTKQDPEPYILGEPQRAGKRNDLDNAITMIQNKKKLTEVAKECPHTIVRYPQGMKQLSFLSQSPRDVNDPPTVLWIYGETGVGKTRLAFDQLPHNEIYMKDSSPWWDGYEQQQCILVDDFDGHWQFQSFIKFIDRYPYTGQIKGSYVHINSPIIIITCEFPPDHFWQGSDLRQVTRRLTLVNHLT